MSLSNLLLFLLPSIIVFFPIYLLIPHLIRYAFNHGWAIDLASDRKIHVQPTPRVGGIAVFLAFSLSNLVVYTLAPNNHESGNTEFLFFQFHLCVGLIFFLGLVDDFITLHGSIKLVVQILLASLFWFWFGGIKHLLLPFFGQYYLPLVFSFFLTLFWIVGITNTFNLIDGIDGLCSGITAISSLGLAVIAIRTNQHQLAVVLLLLFLSTLTFLPYNWPKASAFVGDSGAYLYGFVLAVLSIWVCYNSSNHSLIYAPVILLGLPISDTILAIVRRVTKKQNIFSADSSHIHHQLLSLGLSVKQVVLILCTVNVVFSCIAVSLCFFGSIESFFISLSTVFASFLSVIYLEYSKKK